MTSQYSGQKWVREVLDGHNIGCYNAFRMSESIFYKLLHSLEPKYKLQGSKRTTTIKILGLFLNALARDNSNRDS